MRFVFRDYELDLRRQELRKGGEVVHTEPQVFDLLVLLVQNRDRIVSKDEILDTVWGGRVVSEAAVSSRINAARRAVGDSGEVQALIRTHHKRGFRFVGALEVEDAAAGAAGEPAADPPADAPPGGDGGASAALAVEARAGEIAPAAAPRRDEAPGKPSVAVVPFVNVNQDPEHDYFSYGLTEDVIRLLGRNRWLTVLTRHSTGPQGGHPVEVRELATALNVRYVVRGSVRRHAERVRISVELVGAADERQLWSEVYDLDIQDIFDIQESMAEQIAAVIEPELASVEREVAARKTPGNLDAWDCYQRGLFHLWGFTEPGFAEAERMFARAVELEPGLARAHAALSYVHLQMAFHGDPRARAEHIQAALDLGKVAVSLDERDSLSHCVLGRAYALKQDYPAALAALKTTVALNPSFAQGYFALAFALVFSGGEEEAIALLERAAELSPRDPHLWSFHLTRAYAHFALGELDSAEHFARRATQHPNAAHRPYAMLVAVQGLSGGPEAAAASLRGLLEKRPDYSQAAAVDDLFFCGRRDFVERFVDGLARAGVPA